MSTTIHNKVEKFADRLRNARKAKALGQTELADKLGVSGGSVGNWEIGTSQPRAETLGKLAAILEVTPAWLLYGEGPLVKEVATLREEIVRPSADEAGAAGDDPLRIKCRQYFETFLARCSSRAQLGWLYCELEEHFPMGKFGKPAPARPSSEPVSVDEALLSALADAEPSAAPSRRRKR